MSLDSYGPPGASGTSRIDEPFDWQGKARAIPEDSGGRRFVRLVDLAEGSELVIETRPGPVKRSQFGVFECDVRVRRKTSEGFEESPGLLAPSDAIAGLILMALRAAKIPDLVPGVVLVVQRPFRQTPSGERQFLTFVARR